MKPYLQGIAVEQMRRPTPGFPPSKPLDGWQQNTHTNPFTRQSGTVELLKTDGTTFIAKCPPCCRRMIPQVTHWRKVYDDSLPSVR